MPLHEELREAESELWDMERFGPAGDCPSMATFDQMISAKWELVETLRGLERESADA